MPRSKSSPEKDTSKNEKGKSSSKTSQLKSKASTQAKPKTPAKPKTEVKTSQKPKENLEVVKEELKFHQVFPIKLEHTDKRLNEKKVCYFQCQEHLNSYIKRYKLKKTEYTISDTEPR